MPLSENSPDNPSSSAATGSLPNASTPAGSGSSDYCPKVYLAYLRSESGSIAEHILRASAIAALSGVLGKMLYVLTKNPAQSQNNGWGDLIYHKLSIISLFTATVLLAFYSVVMLIILLLDIEAKVNSEKKSYIFWFFGVASILSMFAVIGSASYLVSTLSR